MNTKKKIIALTLALVCISALAVGGTMAAVTEDGVAHNVITTSGVDIELKEYQIVEGEKKDFPEDGLAGVMPDTTQSKIVQVYNKDIGATAWIRVKVVKDIQLAPGKSGDVDLSLIKLNINTDFWEEKDGFYYYKEELKHNETTQPLFTEVHFDKTMGNLYQESTATVEIIAQAVQTSKNGSSAMTAQGWPALATN